MPARRPSPRAPSPARHRRAFSFGSPRYGGGQIYRNTGTHGFRNRKHLKVMNYQLHYSFRNDILISEADASVVERFPKTLQSLRSASTEPRTGEAPLPSNYEDNAEISSPRSVRSARSEASEIGRDVPVHLNFAAPVQKASRMPSTARLRTGMSLNKPRACARSG